MSLVNQSEPTASHDAGQAPSVSVVTATYNRWPLLQKAIESALNQSYPALEVVVVDDGSTDGSADRVAERYPEVRLIRQENTERGAAYNRGITTARGDFVAFLDDDDVYEPWHLAQFVEHQRIRPDVQFFASQALLWEASTDRITLMPRFKSRRLAHDALLGTIVVPQAMIVARSALLEVGGFPEERAVMGSEDWILLLRLARRFEVVRLPRPSVRVREHPQRSVKDLQAISRSRDVATRMILHERALGEELDEPSRRLVLAGTHRLVAGSLYAEGLMGPARTRMREARRDLGWVHGQRWTGRLWLQTWLGPSVSARLRRVKHRLSWR